MRRSAGPSKGRAGAVTFVQRFGGSLNLHVHFHVLFLEGLFTREPEALPVFHPALAPTRADLLHVLARVRAVLTRWIERRSLASARGVGDDEADADALDACAHAAVQPPARATASRRAWGAMPSASTGSTSTPPCTSAPTTTSPANVWRVTAPVLLSRSSASTSFPTAASPTGSSSRARTRPTASSRPPSYSRASPRSSRRRAIPSCVTTASSRPTPAGETRSCRARRTTTSRFRRPRCPHRRASSPRHQTSNPRHRTLLEGAEACGPPAEEAACLIHVRECKPSCPRSPSVPRPLRCDQRSAPHAPRRGNPPRTRASPRVEQAPPPHLRRRRPRLPPLSRPRACHRRHPGPWRGSPLPRRGTTAVGAPSLRRPRRGRRRLAAPAPVIPPAEPPAPRPLSRTRTRTRSRPSPVPGPAAAPVCVWSPETPRGSFPLRALHTVLRVSSIL